MVSKWVITYNLLINSVYWGYNFYIYICITHLPTIDPNFQRDIHVVRANGDSFFESPFIEASHPTPTKQQSHPTPHIPQLRKSEMLHLTYYIIHH